MHAWFSGQHVSRNTNHTPPQRTLLFYTTRGAYSHQQIIIVTHKIEMMSICNNNTVNKCTFFQALLTSKPAHVYLAYKSNTPETMTPCCLYSWEPSNAPHASLSRIAKIHSMWFNEIPNNSKVNSFVTQKRTLYDFHILFCLVRSIRLMVPRLHGVFILFLEPIWINEHVKHYTCLGLSSSMLLGFAIPADITFTNAIVSIDIAACIMRCHCSALTP